jgi:hypothetical protein
LANSVHSHLGGANVNNDIEATVRVTEAEIGSVVGMEHDVRGFRLHIDARELGSCHKFANDTIMPPDSKSGSVVAAQSMVAKDVHAGRVG